MTDLRRLLILMSALVALVGCSAKAPDPTPSADGGAKSANAAGSGSDIKPLVPGAGPITPMTGGDNLGGTTGGGAAQVMKDRARRAADKASTAPPEPSEDENGDDGGQ